MRLSPRRIAIATLAMLGTTPLLASEPQSGGPGTIERGRYLMRVAGCNDCHSAGYAQSGGQLPEKDWLKGDQVGFSGPWGTTYPTNLRLSMSRMTEAQWIAHARGSEMRPPMPWFSLRAMTTSDLKAIYRYVRHLGPAGEPAPAYAPPGQKPAGPAIDFVPK